MMALRFELRNLVPEAASTADKVQTLPEAVHHPSFTSSHSNGSFPVCHQDTIFQDVSTVTLH